MMYGLYRATSATKFCVKYLRGDFKKKLNGGKDIRRYQLEKINKLIKYAATKNPFYRNLYKEVQSKRSLQLTDLDQIKELPLVTKESLKKALSNHLLYTPELESKGVFTYTTGSTGTPFCVGLDESCVQARRVIENRIWYLCGLYSFRKVLKIWRKKSLSQSDMKPKLRGLAEYISVGDVKNPTESAINEKGIESLIEQIVSFDPEVIRGYASALIEIAGELEKRAIKPSSLKSVICSAEYLPRDKWNYLSNVFRTEVFNVYGGTEASGVAVGSSRDQKMRLSEDLYFIEVLDEEGNPCAPGSPGSITITDLSNRIMPLIRYQIGDLAIVGEDFHSLNSDWRAFDEVLGRQNDIIHLPGGGKVYSHIWYIHFRDELWVEQFQVVQNSIDEIQIKLRSAEGTADRIRNLKNRLSKLYPLVHIKIDLVDRIDAGKGDKLRMIVSTINR